MKVAVIGSGISGLSAAYYLSKKYKVDLFEKDNHFGGHSYTIDIQEDKKVTVDMTLTSPGCPVGPLIQSQIYYKLMDLDALDDVVVNIVWDPPWDPKIMASEEVKLMLGIF